MESPMTKQIRAKKHLTYGIDFGMLNLQKQAIIYAEATTDKKNEKKLKLLPIEYQNQQLYPTAEIHPRREYNNICQTDIRSPARKDHALPESRKQAGMDR